MRERIGKYKMMHKISSRDVTAISFPKTVVYINKTTIYCEHPISQKDREHGLKNRLYLFEHEGMLFDCHGRYQPLFVMSEVLFDLEAIFIGNNLKIKDIVPMRKLDGSTAYTTPKRVPIRYVIEVNKGFCDRHNINIDDTILI